MGADRCGRGEAGRPGSLNSEGTEGPQTRGWGRPRGGGERSRRRKGAWSTGLEEALGAAGRPVEGRRVPRPWSWRLRTACIAPAVPSRCPRFWLLCLPVSCADGFSALLYLLFLSRRGDPTVPVQGDVWNTNIHCWYAVGISLFIYFPPGNLRSIPAVVFLHMLMLNACS